MEDESQRDEMNEAIRAQRERGNVPKSMLPPEDDRPRTASPAEAPAPAPEPEPEPEPEKRGLLARLLGR